MSIVRQVPTDAKIRQELRQLLFGPRLFCPRCGSPAVKKYGPRYRCRRCRAPFSLTSVTWLRGAKLPLPTIWLLLWCFGQEVPLDQAAALCGVSLPTVRSWYGKFRSHVPAGPLSDVRLSGVVQMDEAYRGGKRRGYAIVGAKQAAAKRPAGQRRQLALAVLPKPSVDRRDAVAFLSQHVVPGSTLHTDGSGIYRGIGNWWPVAHAHERHNRWEFALTSEIEGLWGTLTTFVRRMYHHVTRPQVAGVVQEFVARQVYPEWFAAPSTYLQVALAPLPRPARRTSVKFPAEIFNRALPIMLRNLAQKQPCFVPSCL